MSEYKKSYNNNNNGGDDKIKRPRKIAKRKVCQFCVDKQDVIDYKDVAKIKRYISEKGKILPRRTSGVCAKHQRSVAEAVKQARIMALIAFVAD